jgi:phospholipid/cholesterol/gamma-HCH transport system substrate-binding protein
MLLRDEKMAGQIRETMSDVQSMTSNLNQASAGVNSLVADVQQRQFPQKLDDTITQIRSASSQANETIDQVHQSLAQALGPDANGVTAGENISQSLTNINIATGNMVDDTEALKHNFLLKGFFNHRGYYNLTSLSPPEYRRSSLIANSRSSRVWLRAESIFRQGTNGSAELTEDGKRAIDAAVSSFGNSVFKHPLVVEGYSDAATSADELAGSYARAQIVRNHIEARFPFTANNVGVMPLSQTPPPGLEHDRWSGVCVLVALTK